MMVYTIEGLVMFAVVLPAVAYLFGRLLGRKERD